MIKYKNSFKLFSMQNFSLHISFNTYNSLYTYLSDMITSFFLNHYNSKYEILNISNSVVLQAINNKKSEKFNYILIQLRKIN